MLMNKCKRLLYLCPELYGVPGTRVCSSGTIETVALLHGLIRCMHAQSSPYRDIKSSLCNRGRVDEANNPFKPAHVYTARDTPRTRNEPFERGCHHYILYCLNARGLFPFQQVAAERELEASEHRVHVMTADVASLQRRLAEHGDVIRRAQALAEKVFRRMLRPRLNLFGPIVFERAGDGA